MLPRLVRVCINKHGICPLNLTRCYSTRRAILYVPGNDKNKIEKALSLNVDCIALDCEDGVAANKKKEARETICSFLKKGPVTRSKPEWAVRVNSVDSGLCEEDITELFKTKSPPPTILLPKVETTEHIEWFAEQVWQGLIKGKMEEVDVNLIMFIESAKSLLQLPQLCQKAQDLSTMMPIKPVGLVLGSDDLLADIGAARTTGASELLYARQYLVMVAKAYRLEAIDMVNIHFKDLEQLEVEAVCGARMGFTGKQVIHPSQVPVVQKAFMPSPDAVEWAEGLIKAFEEHQADGKGAFTYKGSMIDMPLLKQAQNILRASQEDS